MFEETIKKARQLPTTIVGALLGLVGSAQEPLSVAWFLRLSARFVLVVVYFTAGGGRSAPPASSASTRRATASSTATATATTTRARGVAEAAWRKSAHCDAWETGRRAAWLYSLETTMLWCVSFQYTLLALAVRRPFAYLGSHDLLRAPGAADRDAAVGRAQARDQRRAAARAPRARCSSASSTSSNSSASTGWATCSTCSSRRGCRRSS